MTFPLSQKPRPIWQIEMLYQRYFLRMNQNNAAHIVWLLLALVFLLSIVQFAFVISDAEVWRQNQSAVDDNVECWSRMIGGGERGGALLVYDEFLGNGSERNGTVDGRPWNASLIMELDEVLADEG
jgi:hypothetical protein